MCVIGKTGAGAIPDGLPLVYDLVRQRYKQKNLHELS